MLIIKTLRNYHNQVRLRYDFKNRQELRVLRVKFSKFFCFLRRLITKRLHIAFVMKKSGFQRAQTIKIVSSEMKIFDETKIGYVNKL